MWWLMYPLFARNSSNFAKNILNSSRNARVKSFIVTDNEPSEMSFLQDCTIRKWTPNSIMLAHSENNNKICAVAEIVVSWSFCFLRLKFMFARDWYSHIEISSSFNLRRDWILHLISTRVLNDTFKFKFKPKLQMNSTSFPYKIHAQFRI